MARQPDRFDALAVVDRDEEIAPHVIMSAVLDFADRRDDDLEDIRLAWATFAAAAAVYRDEGDPLPLLRAGRRLRGILLAMEDGILAEDPA